MGGNYEKYYKESRSVNLRFSSAGGPGNCGGNRNRDGPIIRQVMKPEAKGTTKNESKNIGDKAWSPRNPNAGESELGEGGPVKQTMRFRQGVVIPAELDKRQNKGANERVEKDRTKGK
jgi:hypothetical protein